LSVFELLRDRISRSEVDHVGIRSAEGRHYPVPARASRFTAGASSSLRVVGR
jgi:hypothetical protein